MTDRRHIQEGKMNLETERGFIMAEKLDFKKEYKDIYLPKKEPMLIEIPEIRYLMVDGEGAPESADYQEAMQLLYTLSFTIKMSKLNGCEPEHYVDYVVPPLEGLWDCGAGGFDLDLSLIHIWISLDYAKKV